MRETLIGKTYDYDYADDEKKWELVVFDREAEEWNTTGIYCEKETDAYDLKNILNNMEK